MPALCLAPHHAVPHSPPLGSPSQGSTIGLVGNSGSGKSTLVKLILREYTIEPGEGELTLGGRDIKQVSPRYVPGML